MRREQTARTVRHVNLLGHLGVVMHTSLDAATADEAIREEVRYFEGIGQGFEWKLFAHDRPADLKERLERAGFEIGGVEVVLVLEAEAAPARLRSSVECEVRRIEDPDALDDMVAVQAELGDENHDWMVDQLRDELRSAPRELSVYVAYADGAPAATGWIRFRERSPFASLWGGSTRAAYRRRGFYTAVLAARVQEALARGVRFLTVDAGPMSLPILRRLGFSELTASCPCVWKPPTS